ncbi:MAG TPA: hypothetical protein VI977_05370 [archaeon]|nr:hypothetical protein [archaeon]
MDGKEVIIAASDHLITGNFGSYNVEFEHDSKKFCEITERTIMLLAGTTVLQQEFKKKLKASVGETSTVEEIANRLQEIVIEKRMEVINEFIFKPKKLDMEEFYRGGQMRNLIPEIAFKLNQDVETFNLGVELLLAGIDEEGTHLYTINQAGKPIENNQIGFQAIGIGNIHAINTLISEGYSPNLDFEKALFLVFKAKKNSEAAPGVGSRTDLLVITDKKIYYCDDESKKKLELQYKSEKKKIMEFNGLGLKEKIIK